MKKIKSVEKHLKGDIKTFKKEISEDKELISKLKNKKKVGKKKAITSRTTPTKCSHHKECKMKKQSHASRMDESLGMRRGKESTKKQSMASRRHESEGASHPDHHHKAMMHHMKALHKMAKMHHKMK